MSSGTQFPWEPSWSPVGPRGATVRVIQRGPGVAARLLFTARDGNGYDEESLRFSAFDAEGNLAPDRVEAAKREATRFSSLLLSGEARAEARGPLTLGAAADRFREDPAEGPPGMSEDRAQVVRRRLGAVERFLGRDFPLPDLAPSDWRRYHDHRRRGLIDAHGERVPEGERTPVSNDTASKDLQVLRQLCRWATGVREGGKRLLSEDPTRGLDLEWNEDPARPSVSDELLCGLREKAPEITVQLEPGTKDRPPVTAPTALPVLIEVANGTGRRIRAILGLRWGDWEADREFPELGLRGAITFRAEFDKLGRTQTVPVLPRVREALEDHRAAQPDIVPPDQWVFPSPTKEGERLCYDTAMGWLEEAERAARGKHVRNFGWHSFRRRWVNVVGRKLPPATAAKMGGWKDAHVMQTVYERLPDLEETAAALARVAEAGGAG